MDAVVGDQIHRRTARKGRWIRAGVARKHVPDDDRSCSRAVGLPEFLTQRRIRRQEDRLPIERHEPAGNNVGQQGRADRSPVRFPKSPAVDTIIGSEIQHTVNVRQVSRRGAVATGSDVRKQRRSSSGPVALPEFRAVGAVVGTEIDRPSDLRFLRWR